MSGSITVAELLARARAELVRLTPAEARAALATGAVMIDIRPAEQRAREGDVPGARVVERNVLEWRLDPSCEHRDPDLARPDRQLILLCSEGYQSSLAAATLRRFGLDATDVIGGVQAWRDQGLPLGGMGSIRPCRDDERLRILTIVNDAAEAYRGLIPADRWREPYMSQEELDREIEAGVAFWGYESESGLVGVMGIQRPGDVELIRHAYVSPAYQRRGVGGALLQHLMDSATRRVLVGTWTTADWAIAFYLRHGFELLPPGLAADLLRRYWTIPERQVATSVVLAHPPPGP